MRALGAGEREAPVQGRDRVGVHLHHIHVAGGSRARIAAPMAELAPHSNTRLLAACTRPTISTAVASGVSTIRTSPWYPFFFFFSVVQLFERIVLLKAMELVITEIEGHAVGGPENTEPREQENQRTRYAREPAWRSQHGGQGREEQEQKKKERSHLRSFASRVLRIREPAATGHAQAAGVRPGESSASPR